MGKRYRRFPPIPFARRPRRWQRNAYIRLKNRIRRAAPALGGTFYTHDYMDGENAWVNVFFLGRKAPLYYNAMLQTTRFAYRDKVRELSWERSYALAPEDRDPDLFELLAKQPDGNYRMADYEPHRYPELGGMTRDEWEAAEQRIIADSGEVQVFEEWTLHHDYASGIGLHATLDVPRLDITTVGAFIARFMETEREYHGTQGRSWRADEIDWHGVESNAVIEPWVWAGIAAKVPEEP